MAGINRNPYFATGRQLDPADAGETEYKLALWYKRIPKADLVEILEDFYIRSVGEDCADADGFIAECNRLRALLKVRTPEVEA